MSDDKKDKGGPQICFPDPGEKLGPEERAVAIKIIDHYSEHYEQRINTERHSGVDAGA